MEFEGKGADEIAKVKSSTNSAYKVNPGSIVMRVDPNYYRPAEVELLIGDPSKAFEKLGWKPKHNLNSIVSEMVEADVKLFQRDKYLKEGGHEVINYNEE